MVKKYLKSAVKLIFRLNPIAQISGLSIEIMCILLAQETSKLPDVKVGGLKKVLPHVWPRFESQIFFSNFDFL